MNLRPAAISCGCVAVLLLVAAAWCGSTQAGKRALQTVDFATRLARALAVFLHDLRFRACHEIGVLQLAQRLLALASRAVPLAGQARALGVEVDQAGQRQEAGSPRPARSARCRRAARPAPGRSPTRAPAGRRPPTRRCARAWVSGEASRSSIGALTDGGTFISARTVRMAVMKRITQSISARAAASPSGAATGQGAAIRLSGGAEAEAVPQRLGHERRGRVQQAEDARRAHGRRWRAAPAFAGPSAPSSTGLASSTNQSQNTFQVKR